MSDLPPDLRGLCVHAPGLTYKGYRLVCALKEHSSEHPHLCFVPPNEPSAMECVFWTSDGRLLQPVKYGSKKKPGQVSSAGGFTGDSCDSCSSTHMIRNGSCLLCTECGSTTGCS